MEQYLKNEALMEGLVNAANAEAVAAVLAEHSIELETDMTAEKLFAKIQSMKSEELNEDALEDVNGGALGPAIVFRAVAWYLRKKYGR